MRSARADLHLKEGEAAEGRREWLQRERGGGDKRERGLNLHVVSPYGKNHLKADVLPRGTKRDPLALPQDPHLLFYSKEYL